MRNSYLFLLIAIVAGATMRAQVKIGDNPQNIDPSSVLELESTDKVLVITRVTTAQMNAIVPSQGALCFNTDLQSVHYYDGTQWVNIGGGSGTGGPLTADPIVNTQPTIAITPTATGNNLEIAPNSIRSAQIEIGGINGVSIQNGSIGPGKLQNLSVTQEKLSENSVGAFALDNDNIGLSAFNDDINNITANNLISADPDNVLGTAPDGGVFYDDSTVMNDILDNTAAINAIGIPNLDEVLSEGNNARSKKIVGLATPTNPADAATKAYVDSQVATGGSDNQNLGLATLNPTSNVLTINIERGNATAVDLSSLAGGDSNPSDLDFNTTTKILTLTNPATTGNMVDLSSLTGDGGDDDQTAAEVPFTATGNTESTNVQTAIVELQTEINGITAGGEVNTTSNEGVGGVGIVLDKNAPNLPFKSINTGASNIISVTDDSGNKEIDLDIAEKSITADKLNRMGATNNQILVWKADDVDEDPSVGSWVPGTDMTGAATGSITDTEDDDALTDFSSSEGYDVKVDGMTVEIVSDALQVKDGGIDAGKLNRMGATNNQILVWKADDVDADPFVGSWVPGTDMTGTGSITDTEDDDALTDFTNSGGYDVKVDGMTVEIVSDALQVKDGGIDAGKLNRMGATNNQILVWKADDVDEDPFVGSWVPSTNASPIGTANHIFFAEETTGAPIVSDTDGLVWDPEGRIGGNGEGFGALYVGLDGGTHSTKVKVHIADNGNNQLTYPLQIQNRALATGSATGMIFSVDEHTKSYGKGALVFERTGSWAVGDFHFLQNNATGAGTDVNPTLTDKAFTITSNKDVVLYGNLFDKNDTPDSPTPVGHVLTNTIDGTEWAPAGGLPTNATNGQVLTWDADAVNSTTGSWVKGSQSISLNLEGKRIDFLNFDSSINSSIKLDGTIIETFDNETSDDITDDFIRIKPGAIDDSDPVEQILSTTTGGVVGWRDNPSGGNNLATDDQTQDDEDRTYNLRTRNLNFLGSGNIAIGNFDDDSGTTAIPAISSDKLDVNGQIRARDGFAASKGTANLPSYGFYTGDDNNTGMFRPYADQIGFSTGGIEAIRINNNRNVGIGDYGSGNPGGNDGASSKLEVKGSFATAIDRLGGSNTLNENHHTIILTANSTLTLPAVATCKGRLYVIKNPSFAATVTGSGYVNLSGVLGTTSIDPGGTITIQSDGEEWQQIQ